MSRDFILRRKKILPLAGLLLALAVAGCLRDRDERDDPITGRPARIPESRRADSTRDRNYSDARTPAGLASRGSDSASGLGIRERDSASDRPRETDRSVQTTGWTGNGDGPKLQTPVVSPRETRSTPSPGGPMRLRNFEDAESFLTARGCRWQRLEQREGEWFFSCSVPSKRNANSVKTYEAADKYGLVAMQKVIDEINRDQTDR